MSSINPDIHPEWLEALSEEFQKDYFKQIKNFLIEEKRNGQTIYPPGPLMFNAFNRTPFNKVKVVILGQDPYHGPEQAHGLCFSVPDGIKPPPSLVNIFKELQEDLDLPIPPSGNLEPWADRGVLLLNAFLSVRKSSPASHSKIGWEIFTNAVIEKLSQEREGLVFLLWGRFAQNKAELIDAGKHHILKAAHPSPFSAHNGFFGCKHFSKSNALLEERGLEPINWRL
ncbi:MAG: uracil-DNA glycosylase [Chitinophagales bacterium]